MSLQRNYFEDAFGSDWAPDNDQDAVVKFCLNSIFVTKSFRIFSNFISNLEVNELTGDPGWALEKRIKSGENYDDWPEWAMYKAMVDLDEMYAEYPDVYYDSKTFFVFVRAILIAYQNRHTNNNSDIQELLDIINANIHNCDDDG
jgi:hypothetical protein